MTKIVFTMPGWVATTDDWILRSFAEEAYFARAMAMYVGAKHVAACARPLAVAARLMKILANPKVSRSKRRSAADRAVYKYIQARALASAHRAIP